MLSERRRGRERRAGFSLDIVVGGLSTLDAFATELPVSVFASVGTPEIVQHGETGWRVRDRSATGALQGS